MSDEQNPDAEKSVDELSELELYEHYYARTGSEFGLDLLDLIFPSWEKEERAIIAEERKAENKEQQP